MDLLTLNRSRPEVRQMGLMMPPRVGGAQGGEGGRGASSWVVCGVGATAWASPQTAVAALGGVGSASGGKSGAPTSAHCGRRREVRRSRPFSALAHAHIAARSWLIVSDQAIPHRLTVAHFRFRPLKINKRLDIRSDAW